MNQEKELSKLELTDLILDNCHAPDAGLTKDQRYFACWQRAGLHDDQVWGGYLEEGKIIPVKISEGNGLAFRPRVLTAEEDLWVFWTEAVSGTWRVMARCCQHGKWLPPLIIRSAEGAFQITAAYKDGVIWAAWSEQKGSCRYIMGARLESGVIKEVTSLSEESQAYRPALAADQNGNWFLSYDFYNGKNYAVAVSRCLKQVWQTPAVISVEDNWASSVSMTANEKGVSVCWQDFSCQAHIGYWHSDVTVDGDGNIRFQTQKIAGHVSWSIYSDLAGNQKGSQIMIYSWNGKLFHIRYRKGSRPWSDPVELFPGDTSYYIRPRITLAEDETIHLIFQHSNGNGPHERASGISYMKFELKDLYGREDMNCEIGINPFLKPIDGVKALDRIPETEARTWLDQHGWEGNVLRFGDIHGHSDYSDGLGEPDQYYCRAIKAGLDFTALTDHDLFPDILTPSEWQMLQAEANRFNGDDLKTLVAYEWTSNELRYNFGHKNIYYRGNQGGFYPSSSGKALTPDRLFHTLKENHRGEVIVIPHHPSAVWRIASAATDWDFHDEELQRLAEIFSRHASSEAYGCSSVYAKNNSQLPYKSVQDALDRGYLLGIIAGSDSHQMEHGIEGGILAAFMTENSRTALFDALYDRRVYATTGAGILMDFRINGETMGRCIKAASADLSIQISASVRGTCALSKLEIIKNRDVIYCLEPSENRADVEVEDASGDPFGWYYLRVTQADQHMAWSSPIWVQKEEAAFSGRKGIR